MGATAILLERSDGIDHSEPAEPPSERPQGLQLGRGEAEQNLFLPRFQKLAVSLDGRADVPGLDRLVEYPSEGLVFRVPLRGNRQYDLRQKQRCSCDAESRH